METHVCRGRRMLSATVLSAAVAASVTACGTTGSSAPAAPLSGLSADQIATKAVDNLKTTSTVRVSGDVSSSGQTYELDLTLVRARGCTGTLAQTGTGSFKMIAIGGQVWIKPNRQFWKNAGGAGADAAVLQLLVGKYLKVKASSQLGSLSGFCGTSQLAGSFGSKLTGLVKGKTTTIAGQAALQIKDSGDASSIFVSDTAKPELLQLSGGAQGNLEFTDYNIPMTLTAPPARETLSGAKYGF
jgi:hypothetical protein